MFTKPYSIIKCFLILSMLSPLSLWADMVVIVHPSNNSEITKAQVKKIFLGRSTTFNNGEKAIAIETEGGKTKEQFLKQVIRKDKSAVESYWARMLFTGKATPPKQYSTEEEVKKLVASNPNTIGYIDSLLVDDSVKAISLK